MTQSNSSGLPLHRPIRGRAFAIAVSAAAGLGSASYLAFFLTRHSAGYRADFDHLYAAARFVLDGRNPYALIGPGREFPNRWPLYYPLPAILLIVPFSLLPLPTARLAFVGCSSAVIGYALALRGGTRWRYSLFASRQWLECVLLAQWTPILYAMWSVPVLAATAVIKPNVSAALLGAKADGLWIRMALFGGLALLAASLVVQWDWPVWWWRQIINARHFGSALFRPGGFVLLAALLRWRRADARLILALAIIPQTPSFYDALLFFLVADTSVEFVTLLVAGEVLDLVILFHGAFPNTQSALTAIGRWSIPLLYLPCLIMVLRRPNTGPAPSWLEERLHRIPPWLRGSPSSGTLETETSRAR